jgi:hypothetical protein
MTTGVLKTLYGLITCKNNKIFGFIIKIANMRDDAVKVKK